MPPPLSIGDRERRSGAFPRDTRTARGLVASTWWLAASVPVLLAQAPQAPVFRAEAALVEVIVRVTDEQGRFVPDLTREDFALDDEGRPQTIVAFDRVNRSGDALAPARTSTAPIAAPDSSAVATNAAAAEARLFVLLLDDMHTAPARTGSARAVARKFVTEYAAPSDLLGVYFTSGLGGGTQELTTDKARVLAAIDHFTGRRNRCCEIEQEAAYHARITTDLLQQLARHFARVRGRRISLLWISEGIDYDLTGISVPRGCPVYSVGDPPPADHVSVAHALENAVNALRRANVTLYAADPRRLALDSDIDAEIPGRGCGKLPDTARNILSRSMDNLRSLSEQTGGFAALNTNDFDEAFERVLEENSRYYVLGFQPSRTGAEGEFRRIRVRLPGRPRLRVSARSGYVVSAPLPPAPAPSGIGPVLASALTSSVPVSGLPLRVQAVPRRGAGGRALVHLIVEVAGRDLGLVEREDRFVERVEFGVLAIDRLARLEHVRPAAIDLSLTPDQVQQIRRTGVRWLSTIDLASGSYSLRVAAHATGANLTGATFLDVDVPEYGSNRLGIDGLAVTSLPAALTVTTGTSPVVLGLSGPPTTTRTFVRGDTLTLSADVSVPSDFVSGSMRLTVWPQASAAAATPMLERTIDLPTPDVALRARAYAVDTSVLPPGAFVLRLAIRDRDGRSAETAMAFDVIEPGTLREP